MPQPQLKLVPCQSYTRFVVLSAVGRLYQCAGATRVAKAAIQQSGKQNPVKTQILRMQSPYASSF